MLSRDLSLVFRSLTILCLGEDFFGFALLGFTQVYVFYKIGNLPVITPLRFFSNLPSFSFPGGNSQDTSISSFILVPQVSGAVFVCLFQPIFFVFRLDNMYYSTSSSLILSSYHSNLLLSPFVLVFIMAIVFSLLNFPFSSSFYLLFLC